MRAVTSREVMMMVLDSPERRRRKGIREAEKIDPRDTKSET
jgi:hypothetical protein